MQTTRTVQVKELSDLAGEREIHEFFSFSGEIEHIQIHRSSDNGKSAFVTFKDAKALEIALLLSGATIVDQIVRISPAKDYVPIRELQEQPSPPRGRVYVNKAQVVVTNMLAKGSAISQDAVNKAKAFDEKHRLTASASDKVISFNRRVKLKEKLAVGISAVNEKVKSVDQKLHVSDRTMAAIFAAETKINNTGSAVKSNRYVTAGSAWLSGAFGKVAKAG
ncbi:Binding partner of ACD11 1 [Linum perenne]